MKELLEHLVDAAHDEILNEAHQGGFNASRRAAEQAVVAVLRKLRSPTFRNVIPASSIQPLTDLIDEIEEPS